MNIWQSYKQERRCLVHFVRLATTPLKDEESARDNHVRAGNFAKCSPFLLFHKVAWQHVQWMMGLRITIYCKFTKESWKKCCKSIKIWQNYGHDFVASVGSDLRSRGRGFDPRPGAAA